jgi:hypothetical protein
MTTSSTQGSPRSRRAVLAGALGGLGAWVAAAAARVDPAAAAVGDPIRMGRLNKASNTETTLQATTGHPAYLVNQRGLGPAVKGVATSGRAVMGVAGSDGTGVWAYSPDHYAVHAECLQGTAVKAESGDTAILASGGLYGVMALTGSGVALYARGLDGHAGVFQGPMSLEGYQDIGERADPGAPASDFARLFARDDGTGKTQLCVRFPTGAVQVIATEP